MGGNLITPTMEFHLTILQSACTLSELANLMITLKKFLSHPSFPHRVYRGHLTIYKLNNWIITSILSKIQIPSQLFVTSSDGPVGPGQITSSVQLFVISPIRLPESWLLLHTNLRSSPQFPVTFCNWWKQFAPATPIHVFKHPCNYINQQESRRWVKTQTQSKNTQL